MIEKYSRPQCYNAFYSTKADIKKTQPVSFSVKAASVVGSGIGALGAAYAISKHQTKILNKSINLFGIKYTEPEILKVALSSVAGGFALGALSDDKKYLGAKTKEAVHQVIANILAPIATIWIGNKLFDKIEHKIKLPKFNSKNKVISIINTSLNILPRLAVTTLGLITGLYSGTKISNILNGTDKTPSARNVKALDYIYHPDDFAAALALADKNGTMQKFVAKIIPPVFMLHGIEAGTKR